MTIIFIDDDPEDAELFCEAITVIDPSMDCLIFRDGVDALDQMITGQLPNIVFVDINMTKMGGRDVLLQIRKEEKLKKIKVVMFSTSLENYQFEIYRNLGADLCLRKPNTFGDLVRELRLILSEL